MKLTGHGDGKGIYFTNKVLKALRFSIGSKERSVLLLSEVALGTSALLDGTITDGKRFVHFDSGGKSKWDYHSCQVATSCCPDARGNVVDSDGTIWPVGQAPPFESSKRNAHHEEIVMFNAHQTRMRYIVVLEGGTSSLM